MKLKQITKFIAICVLLVLSSCEKDLYEDAINDHPLLVKRLNYNQLQKQPKIVNEVLSFKNKQAKSSNKSLEEYAEIFDIDMNNIMYIQEANKETYTFKISRDGAENILENLVFTKKINEDDYKVILAQYKESLYNSSFLNETLIRQLFPDESLYKDITNEESIPLYLTKQSADCLEAVLIMSPSEPCRSGKHTFADGSVCDYWGTVDMATFGSSSYVVQSVPCQGGGGGGGFSNSDLDGFSTGPHGGGGGNSEPKKTPCQQLKEMNTKPIANTSPPKTVLSNLNDLTTQIATNPRERMFVMTPTTESENEYVETYVEGSLNGDGVFFSAGLNVLSIIMHCHYNTSQYSIFSLQDLQEISFYLDSGNIINPETFTSIVVTAQGTKYALKITPPNTTFDSNNYLSTFFVGWEFDNIKNSKEDIYKENVKEGNTPAQNELGFLKFLKTQKIGFELYKADATFSQWTKLSLATNGQVIPTPCP